MKDPGNGKAHSINFEEIIDDHVLTSVDTPLRCNAFKIDDELKIELTMGAKSSCFRTFVHPTGLEPVTC